MAPFFVYKLTGSVSIVNVVVFDNQSICGNFDVKPTYDNPVVLRKWSPKLDPMII